MAELAAILFTEIYSENCRKLPTARRPFKFYIQVNPYMVLQYAKFHFEQIEDGGTIGHFVEVPPFLTKTHFTSYTHVNETDCFHVLTSVRHLKG